MSARPLPLEHGYISEVDKVDKDQWSRIIARFSDASIYQTWSYDAIRCGKENISHLVLRSGNEIKAAAQARIVRIPFIGRGAAYARWAPLWQHRSQHLDPTDFRLALRALRNEYVCRRGLILRIFPVLYDDGSRSYSDLLLQEGYTAVPNEDRGRTLIVDINQPLADLRKKLDQKWRNCLNKAERNQLEVTEGTDDDLFAAFIGIYRELLERKKFEEPNDINEFRMIQRDLPPEHKMRIFICQSDNVRSSGVICASVGEAGIYLFGATSDAGMRDKGSYLLQWKAIEWMKNNGCLSYNLNGINPQKNPGSYHFKAGLSGKNGRDLCYLGRFDCYPDGISAKLARAADRMLPLARRAVSRLSIAG